MNKKEVTAKIIIFLVVICIVGFIYLIIIIKQNTPLAQNPPLITTTSPASSSTIKIGKVTLDQKSFQELQFAVLDGGHQPWRLDPESVIKAEIEQYGFINDDLTSLQQVSAPKNGTVNYQIAHTNPPLSDYDYRFYLVTLIQPVKNGIWVISDIESNTVPIKIQSLSTNFFNDNSQQIITAYELPTPRETNFGNHEVKITSTTNSGAESVIFTESELKDAGGGIELKKITSSNGKNGVVVIESPSAADGGREAWHILTAENGKIVRLDRSNLLKQPLLQNGFDAGTYTDNDYIFAYAQIAVNGDKVIETIPTDPLPNGGKNVVLEFHFKFTGDSLELLSVKKT